jgi:hypothetical protein
MKDNGIARTAGTPSAGADSPLRYWAALPLANGESVDLVVTVGVTDRPGSSDSVLEGSPPAIDFPVAATAQNRGRYLDAVLAAIAW